MRHTLAQIALLLTLSACGSHESTPAGSDASRAAGRDAQQAVPVVAATVEMKPMPITLGAVGTVEAISSVDVRAQVTGELREIFFTPGQPVKKGQPLFALDPRPFEAELRQAQAMLARDTAQADAARTQGTRAQSLFDRGLLARNEFETQTAAAKSLEATIAADQAQVDQAKLNLQYARIAAPMDGLTGELTIHPGDLVRANDTNPLVTINQLAPIYVTFAVPSRFLADIHRFSASGPLKVIADPTATSQSAAQSLAPQQMAASTATATGTPAARPRLEGTVSFIDNAVDPSTATIKLKATFANEDRSLWPGLFVQVSVQLSVQEHALVVPAMALQASQQGTYVYVVKQDRTVEMRKVSLDRQQGDDAVIGSGLSAGESVVTDGQLRLTPGARVTVQPGEASS